MNKTDFKRLIKKLYTTFPKELDIDFGGKLFIEGLSWGAALLGEASNLMLNAVDTLIPEKYVGASELVRGTREGMGYFDYLTSGEKYFSEVKVKEMRSGGVRKNVLLKWVLGKPVDWYLGIRFFMYVHETTGVVPLLPPFIVAPQLGAYMTFAHDVINIPLRYVVSLPGRVFEECGYKYPAKLFKFLDKAVENFADFFLGLKLLAVTPGVGEAREVKEQFVNLLRSEDYKKIWREDFGVEEKKPLYYLPYTLFKTIGKDVKKFYMTYKKHFSERKLFPNFMDALERSFEEKGYEKALKRVRVLKRSYENVKGALKRYVKRALAFLGIEESESEEIFHDESYSEMMIDECKRENYGSKSNEPLFKLILKNIYEEFRSTSLLKTYGLKKRKEHVYRELVKKLADLDRENK